ncbi:MAG: hypothetical protein HY534_04280 [Chloroflexi bacterium]|nr:hypothetical protein [Chloroflexota bacterium]
MEESTTTRENPPALTAGAIIASAVLAALVAFFLRRAMRSEQETPTPRILEQLSEVDLRERARAATGEFLRSYVGPEVRPILLSVIRDVHEYVDRGFQRAEQSIKEI